MSKVFYKDVGPKPPTHQINIIYRDRPYTQFLSPNQGPIMYPTTHSIPGPFIQSYINLPNRSYMY